MKEIESTNDEQNLPEIGRKEKKMQPGKNEWRKKDERKVKKVEMKFREKCK